LDPIEKAIRSAFEKGNAEDRTFREKVYRKAFAALDRAIQANPGRTVEQAIARRKALQAKITEIESEFIPAVQAPEPTVDIAPPRTADPVFDTPLKASPDPHSIDFGPGSAAVPPLAGSAAPEVEAPAGRPHPPRRRRPYAIFFIAATLLALIGMGVWFGVQTGLFKSPSERDTSVPNPPAQVEGEDFIPENEEPPALSGTPDPAQNWINVFDPADATQLAAPSDTVAELLEDESGAFLRVRSGASGSAMMFDVGQGVLEQVAGRKATFDIVARAEDGAETEMSIDCNFGELGDCGRKRYVVGYERADYLFEIDFPAKQPGAGGTIAINSDFAGKGRAVDIYEIRVAVAPAP
jgi:hypothetical protein